MDNKLKSSPSKRLMAVYPTTKGFGYLIIEDSQNIVNWGVVNHKHDGFLTKKFLNSVKKYGVDVLITEHFGKDSQRKFKAINRTMMFRRLARTHKLSVTSFSKEKVDVVFGSFGAYTKESRACVVASQISPLKKWCPPKRKAWQPEHHRMAVFDCAVLSLVYLYMDVER